MMEKGQNEFRLMEGHQNEWNDIRMNGMMEGHQNDTGMME